MLFSRFEMFNHTWFGVKLYKSQLHQPDLWSLNKISYCGGGGGSDLNPAVKTASCCHSNMHYSLDL